MKVYLAGGIHHDPLCRPALVSWLANLTTRLGELPVFVAVEMDDGIAYQFKHRRASLKRLFGGLWNEGVAEDVRQALADTLAWEVDSHRKVLPDLEPIFLDRPGSRSVAVTAHLFFNLAIQALDGYDGDRKSVHQVTKWISGNICSQADATWQTAYDDKQPEQATRQKEWMTVLEGELNQEGWGLAVIGALHATRYDRPNMLRCLLEDRDCLGGVEYLTWAPPANIK